MTTLRLEGADRITLDLDAIASPRMRRRIVQQVARQVRQNSIQRARAQTDLQGVAFAKHKQGRRRKMLTRLAGRLKIVASTDDSATVGFASPVEAEIGAKQQFGYTETFSEADFKDRNGPNTKAPATRRQAKALREAGYKVRRPNGRGHVVPTLKWIMTNLNIGKAGVILRALRGSKASWQTTLPPRAFLGVSEAELNELAVMAINEIEGRLIHD